MPFWGTDFISMVLVDRFLIWQLFNRLFFNYMKIWQVYCLRGSFLDLLAPSFIFLLSYFLLQFFFFFLISHKTFQLYKRLGMYVKDDCMHLRKKIEDVLHNTMYLKTKNLKPLHYSRLGLEAETWKLSATRGRRTLQFWLSSF